SSGQHILWSITPRNHVGMLSLFIDYGRKSFYSPAVNHAELLVNNLTNSLVRHFLLKKHRVEVKISCTGPKGGNFRGRKTFVINGLLYTLRKINRFLRFLCS